MSTGLLNETTPRFPVTARLRPLVWAGLAIYFVLSFGGAAYPGLLLPRLLFVFFFFLALRVLDDLRSASYEKRTGIVRFYHDGRESTVYGMRGALFAMGAFLVLPRTAIPVFALSSLLAFTALGYALSRETVYVKWVSLLKYPFLVLMLSPAPFPIRSVFALGIAGLFTVREAQEEGILKSPHWKWGLIFGAFFILLASITYEMLSGGIYAVERSI